MDVKKRSGARGSLPKEVGSKARNAVNQRKDAVTQASAIRNQVSKPKSVGVGGIRNAVNSPKG